LSYTPPTRPSLEPSLPRQAQSWNPHHIHSSGESSRAPPPAAAACSPSIARESGLARSAQAPLGHHLHSAFSLLISSSIAAQWMRFPVYILSLAPRVQLSLALLLPRPPCLPVHLLPSRSAPPAAPKLSLVLPSPTGPTRSGSVGISLGWAGHPGSAVRHDHKLRGSPHEGTRRGLSISISRRSRSPSRSSISISQGSPHLTWAQPLMPSHEPRRLRLTNDSSSRSNAVGMAPSVSPRGRRCPTAHPHSILNPNPILIGRRDQSESPSVYSRHV
jgi:hypothetical protein